LTGDGGGGELGMTSWKKSRVRKFNISKNGYKKRGGKREGEGPGTLTDRDTFNNKVKGNRKKTEILTSKYRPNAVRRFFKLLGSIHITKFTQGPGKKYKHLSAIQKRGKTPWTMVHSYCHRREKTK